MLIALELTTCAEYRYCVMQPYSPHIDKSKGPAVLAV